jgi:hypothetical protein
MLLRQEAALDRSIDRKVRILLKLRENFADLPSAAAGQRKGGKMENEEEAVRSDNMSTYSQGLEVVETS